MHSHLVSCQDSRSRSSKAARCCIADVRLSQAYNQALAEYRYTVLIAFQNVADSLRALEADADYVKAQAAAERSASESFRVARDQYQAGYISYPSLLAAQYAYQQTIISLVQAEASRYADTAALFQALGGGWWNRIGCRPDESRGLLAP